MTLFFAQNFGLRFSQAMLRESDGHTWQYLVTRPDGSVVGAVVFLGLCHARGVRVVSGVRRWGGHEPLTVVSPVSSQIHMIFFYSDTSLLLFREIYVYVI